MATVSLSFEGLFDYIWNVLSVSRAIPSLVSFKSRQSVFMMLCHTPTMMKLVHRETSECHSRGDGNTQESNDEGENEGVEVTRPE